MVPAGSLPALDHDGLLISDSEAIGEYLNEAFPEPEMLPGTVQERAKIRELSRFHDTRLEPSVRALFPLIKSGGGGDGGEMLERNWQAMAERLDQLTPLLPPRRGPLTLADCGLAVTGAWIDVLANHFGFANPANEAITNYLNHLTAHDAVGKELADYRPKLTNWLANQ